MTGRLKLKQLEKEVQKVKPKERQKEKQAKRKEKRRNLKKQISRPRFHSSASKEAYKDDRSCLPVCLKGRAHASGSRDFCGVSLLLGHLAFGWPRSGPE